MEADNADRPLPRVEAKISSFRYVFRKMTPFLFTCWMMTALLNVIFGYETTSFAGVQNIPAFEREFGTPNADGEYALTPARASYTSSSAFAGKLLGSLVSEREPLGDTLTY